MVAAGAEDATSTVYVTGAGPTEPLASKYSLGRDIGTPGQFGKAVRCKRTRDGHEMVCKILNKRKYKHLGK